MHTAFDLFLSRELLQIFQQTPGLPCGQIEKSCSWHPIRKQHPSTYANSLLVGVNRMLKPQVTDCTLTADDVYYRKGDLASCRSVGQAASIKLCEPHELVKPPIRFPCYLNYGIKKTCTHIHPCAWQGCYTFADSCAVQLTEKILVNWHYS